MLSLRMVLDHTYLTWSTHNNLSCSHQQSWAGPLLPRKRALGTIYSTPTNWSTGMYPVSLSRQPLKQWGQSQPSANGWLLGLRGPYLWHVIGMFNTCSWGPTHRSLTDRGMGYNLGGVGFPHDTPHPSQPMVLRFPPKCPVWSQVIQSQHKLLLKCDMKHLSPTHGFSTTLHLPKSISTPSNGQHHPSSSKVIKGNMEGIHNATTVPINSY
jgi:hypothetical protein